MATPHGITRFINKTVSLRFNGRDLGFHLSHALFSSYDIDEGTRLLLKTLAREVDLASLHSVLDIGCGVGVIGAAVAAHAPAAEVVMQDRDALAVAFALENCRANRLRNVQARCALAFHALDERSFDLVTSNLPAKAGAPVLKAFFRHAAGCLTDRGRAAVVIVAPLAAAARETVEDLGCTIHHVEATRSYTVLHFGAGRTGRETDADREDLSPYIRTSALFSAGSCSYSLQTAHSLPDFDTTGYSVQLALDLLTTAASARNILAWNPGQGHAAVGLLAMRGKAAAPVSIAARDCLESAICGLNLAAAGQPPAAVAAFASEAELGDGFPSGAFDLLVAAPRAVPRVPWQPHLAASAGRLLRAGGELLVTGSSTDLHRFLDQPLPFQLKTSRKQYGFRAVILRRA